MKLLIDNMTKQMDLCLSPHIFIKKQVKITGDLFLSVKTSSNLLLPDGCEEDGRDGERGRWDLKK